MRGMKITVDAAMRARDVSRPRAEHEALAQVGEAADPKPAGPADPAPDGAARLGRGRRRRRGRNHGR
jgi:hypothetical protein